MLQLLSISNLSVWFSGASGLTPTLSSLRLALAPGQVIGLLGESGCGKTTTALAILGLLPAAARVASGSIRFAGRELLGSSEAEMRALRGAQISLIPQEPGIALNPVLRVGEQIGEVLRAHLPWGRKQCRMAAEEMLAQVGFSDVPRIYQAFPHQLSGGQQQRVTIAQALVCRPQLVIADEPTSSLDPASRAEILALLKRLRHSIGVAMLFISHQPAVLAEIADRVVVMHKGRIVEEGPTAQVLENPQHPYPQALLGCDWSRESYAVELQ